jgi:hypothetical protein
MSDWGVRAAQRGSCRAQRLALGARDFKGVDPGGDAAGDGGFGEGRMVPGDLLDVGVSAKYGQHGVLLGRRSLPRFDCAAGLSNFLQTAAGTVIFGVGRLRP